ncbi:hypothetical protein D3C78_1759020 [compost metagenome]
MFPGRHPADTKSRDQAFGERRTVQRHVMAIPRLRGQRFFTSKVEFAVNVILNQRDVVLRQQLYKLRFFLRTERETEWILTVRHQPAGLYGIIV